ncbi:MAG: restriction endonuclease subunit S [Verrucomicrobia bacterium]|nr:restriction endonuclease subunit S [Verrucomicrobiota bacterium]
MVADVVRVRLDESRFSRSYALFAINSPAVANHINSEMMGSTRPRVNLNNIRDLQIPIAPLPEQQRIVAKLTELLGKVDASQQRLAKIPALIKRFRQSVLAAACSGRLTADWREERTTDDVDVADGDLDLPRSWKSVEFGELIGDGPQNGLYKPASFYGDGTLIVRIDASSSRHFACSA